MQKEGSLVRQALDYELNREDPNTFLNTVRRHSENLQISHGQFLPYKLPLQNILDISEDKLKSYIKVIFDNNWKSKLEHGGHAP